MRSGRTCTKQTGLSTYEIVECRPSELVRFQVTAGPVRPTGTYRLAQEDGSTRVSVELSYQSLGIMRLLEPMIARTMRSEAETLESHPE